MLPGFGVGVSVAFRLTCVHVILVRFQLLSSHLLRIAAYSVDHMFSFVFWLVILFISHFVLKAGFGFLLLQFLIFAYFLLL